VGTLTRHAHQSEARLSNISVSAYVMGKKGGGGECVVAVLTVIWRYVGELPNSIDGETWSWSVETQQPIVGG
jgi:hypothetical protein